MNIEILREYCLSKKAVTEELPFDDTTLVFKVMGKMFALTTIGNELSVNLKCDPEMAIRLREEYHSVIPGYHMSKVHWNTVKIDGAIPWKTICEWIDLSYNLVVAKLPKNVQNELKNL